MATAHQRFTIFQDDDATPLLGTVDGSGNVTVPTASTDPTATRPYMIRSLDQGESAVDFIEGSSMTGSMNVDLLDKRVTASDQTSGWFTAILSGSNGQSQLIGRRILVEQQAEGTGTWYCIIDGVIGDVSLNSDYVSYSIAIRDMRERERKCRAFTKSFGLSVYPRGFINGYGKFGADYLNTGLTLLARQLAPMNATFRIDPTGGSLCGLAVIDGNPKYDEDYTAELTDVSYMSQNFKNTDTLASSIISRNGIGSLITTAYNKIRVGWRARGSTGAYTILSNMPVIPNTTFSSSPSAFVSGTVFMNNVFLNHGIFTTGDTAWVMSSNSGGTDLPTNGQQIEIYVEYVGVPTEKYPLYIEAPMGQLLKDLYDGVYSDEATRIRYNTTTVGALVTKLPYGRAKITEPVEDIREWTESNIYKPNGYAPSIDLQGKISPVNYTLPDVSVSLFQLDDSNIVEGGASWLHDSQQIANKVVFKYIREYTLPPGSFNSEIIAGIGERDVEFVDIHPSVGLLGDHKVEYEPNTIRSIGSPAIGAAINGQILDETGPKLAQARAVDLFDRFAYGVQKMEIKAQRRDASVAAAKVGDWCFVASSWMPNYATGKRGINRVAQIISIKDIDPACRLFTLLDGGPNSTPVNAPTIGTLTVSGASVNVPITAIPAGLNVNIEYAVASTLPGTNTAAWQFLARIDAVGTVKTPLLPPGSTVWARARGVGETRRPSAWVTSASVTTSINPAISEVYATVDTDSPPVLRWKNTASAQGVRVTYAVYNIDAAIPTSFSAFGDVASSAEILIMTGITVRQKQAIIINVTPYSVFSGGVASGTAGTTEVVFASRLDIEYIQPTMSEAPSNTTTVGTMVLTPFDPQLRLSLVEFRTFQDSTLIQDWTGTGQIGGLYTQTVPIVSGKASLIEWRITAINKSGVGVIVSQKSFKFVVGSPPTARIDFVSETSINITVNLVGALGVGTAGALSWQWRTNNNAFTAPATTALPVQITVARNFKHITKLDLLITGPDGQTANATHSILGIISAIADGDGKIDRGAPFSQGGFAAKATDLNGWILDPNNQDSRLFPLNTMFRFGIDSTNGVMDGTGSPLAGGIRGFIGLDATGWQSLGVRPGGLIADRAAGLLAKQGGTLFTDSFETTPSGNGWTWTSGGVGSALSLVSSAGSIMGSTVLRSTGYNVLVGTNKIPYNPNKLYRIRARVRQHVYPTAGQSVGTIYVGLRMFDDAGAVTTTNQGNAYVCHAARVTAVDAWVEAVGWFKGSTGSNTSTPGVSTDPRSPATLATGTTQIVPLMLLNFNTPGDGQVDVDYVIIEEMDEDASLRVYSTVQSDNASLYGTVKDARAALLNNHFRYGTDISTGVMEVSDRRFVSDNQQLGAGRGFTGLNSSGQLQTKVLPDALIADQAAATIARKAGTFFVDNFDADPTTAGWSVQSGVTPLSSASSASTMGEKLAWWSGGYGILVGNKKIAFNPKKLYRIRARVLTSTANTAGTTGWYLGLIQYDYTGAVLSNTNGGVAYVGASNVTPVVGTFTEYVGWFKGATLALTSYPSTPSTDPTSPRGLNVGCVSVVPLIYAGYNGSGGQFFADYFVIDEFDEDGTNRTYSVISVNGQVFAPSALPPAVGTPGSPASITKTIRVHHSLFVPGSDVLNTYTRSPSGLAPSIALGPRSQAALEVHAPAYIPPGATITNINMRHWMGTGVTGGSTVTFYRYSSTGVATTIGTNNTVGGGGAAAWYDTGFSAGETVSATSAYALIVVLNSSGGLNNEQTALLYVEITYTMPDYSKTI